MKKFFWILGFLLALSLVLFFFGPKADKYSPDLALPEVFLSAQEKISSEQNSEDIRRGCGSILRYADDSLKSKTPFVILYLHGFSASPIEGDPVMFNIAERFGMNLYAPRLAAHGLATSENLLTFTAEDWINSAKGAIQQAASLGDSIIIMSTSTGGTSALYLSNAHPKIHSLICYSPNTQVAREESDVLLSPWGLQIGRIISGGKYYKWEVPESAKPYWYSQYRIEALVQLKRLIEATMTDETFRAISKPLFVGYYFKNEKEKDDQVSVARMEEMFDLASTPDHKKWFVNFEAAGAHCIPSRHFSRDIPAVQSMTERFFQDVLKISPTNSTEESTEFSQ